MRILEINGLDLITFWNKLGKRAMVQSIYSKKDSWNDKVTIHRYMPIHIDGEIKENYPNIIKDFQAKRWLLIDISTKWTTIYPKPKEVILWNKNYPEYGDWKQTMFIILSVLAGLIKKGIQYHKQADVFRRVRECVRIQNTHKSFLLDI